MMHHFDVAVAEKVGVHAAILLDNFIFWIEKNRVDRKHFHDGKTWTYISKRGLTEYFPYLTERQIKYALSKLEDNGMIQKGNFNQNPYDRTLWYTVTKPYLSTGQNCPMTSDEIVQPIPYTNPDTNNTIPPLSNTLSNERLLERPPEGAPPQKSVQRKFVPPKLEEVEDYCRERGNAVDASRFMDYYESVGWKVGKQSMKDWKAAVRTWERRDGANLPRTKASQNNADSLTSNPFMGMLESE